MTDKEIIKALKCCSNGEPCANCPYQKQCDETDLAEIALDLINRQQAEIKEWQRTAVLNANEIIKLQAENERLKKENEILSINADTAFQDGLNEAQDLYAKQVKAEIKSEAVKEFAERLKNEMRLEDDCQYDCINCYYECNEYVPIIDNVLKEMAGDTE